MRSMNSLRIMIVGCFLVLCLSAGWAAEALSLRVWEFNDEDWEGAKLLLTTSSGALVAEGKTFEMPDGAWTRMDERKRMVAILDTAERLQALEKLLGRKSMEANMQWRLFDVGSDMALKSKNHVRHQLMRHKEYEDVEIKMILFESDLLVKAPTEKMSEIAGWIDSIQPKEPVVAKEPEERRPVLLRNSVLSKQREPSPYLTGRPVARGGFMAGYSHSSSAYVSGMGRYGAAHSSTNIGVYASPGSAVLGLDHQESSYVLDAINQYLSFDSHSSSRGISFDNGYINLR